MNEPYLRRNHRKTKSLLQMPSVIDTNKFMVNCLDFSKKMNNLKYSSYFREINPTKPNYFGEGVKDPIYPAPEILSPKEIQKEMKQLIHRETLPTIPKQKNYTCEEVSTICYNNLNSIHDNSISVKKKRNNNKLALKNHSPKINNYNMEFLYPSPKQVFSMFNLYSSNHSKIKLHSKILSSKDKGHTITLKKISNFGNNKKYQYFSFDNGK